MASAMGVYTVAPRARLRSKRAVIKSDRSPPDFEPGNRGDLASLIEGEIIPRLLVAHPPATLSADATSASRITPAEASAFALMPLTLEAEELLRQVESYFARGVSPETVFLDLLAPSARELGRLWEDDLCSFVDVTMGLWRLQEVMREISWRTPDAINPLVQGRRALFAGMPGEQHSFGTLMINDIFDRAGWRCKALIEPTRRQLLTEAQSKPLDLIGLTVTRDCRSAEAKDLIKAIRSVSHNPQVRVMIGGRAVNLDPAFADEAGADGTAVDAQAALSVAEALVRGTQRLAAIAD